MPTYTFRNTSTGQEYELNMPMSERESYLEKNPEVIQILNKINVGDPITLGVKRPPEDFLRNVIGRIKEKEPLGTSLERRYTVPREW